MDYSRIGMRLLLLLLGQELHSVTEPPELITGLLDKETEDTKFAANRKKPCQIAT